jgi:hypothetical protein
MTMRSIRALTGPLLAAWLMFTVAPAEAGMLFSDAVLVRGRENLTSLELPVDAIGTYRVTATDLKWFGTPLEALSFGVFTSTQPLKIMEGAGTLEFFKAQTGKIFLQIYTQTAGPRFANLVAIQLESVAPPVPLPASGELLLSLLTGGWLFHARRRVGEYARRSVECATALVGIGAARAHVTGCDGAGSARGSEVGALARSA